MNTEHDHAQNPPFVAAALPYVFAQIRHCAAMRQKCHHCGGGPGRENRRPEQPPQSNLYDPCPGIATQGVRAAKPADADKAAPEKGTLSIRERSVRAGPVSRVLFRGEPRTSVTLSRAAVSCRLKQPTPGIGRATLNCRYTRSCNRETYCRATSLPRGGFLTPPFSPYPPEIPCGRFFSVTLYLTDIVISLRGALRCPDFPLPATAGSDRADLHRKGNKIRQYSLRGQRYSENAFPSSVRAVPMWRGRTF